jgi:hypothetical protein
LRSWLWSCGRPVIQSSGGVDSARHSDRCTSRRRYIGDDGYAAISFRGSTQVHGAQQLAVWARKPGEGFAKTIGDRPEVSLLYYSPDGPGPRYLSIQGHAKVTPSVNDEVYAKMIEGERQQDPDRNGVAVIVDVQTVNGFGGEGPFQMQR